MSYKPSHTGQTADTNNTTVYTNASAEFVGGWTAARSAGVVRQLVTLTTDATTILGGTFTFEYSNDGVSAAISESRPITDLRTIKDFDLLNAGGYFRVRFTPSRTVTGAEKVYITTTNRGQDDGSFVRLADQQIERQNAAMGQVFSYLKAFDPVTGNSTNVSNFNQIVTSTQVPSSPLGIGEEFTGSDWVDTAQIGHFIYLMAGVEAFTTVELEWSDDGISPNGQVTALTNDPLSGYNVYLHISSVFVTGRFWRAHIVNGGVAQSAAQVGIATIGKDPYMPIIGVNKEISLLQSPLLTRSIIAGVDASGVFRNVPTNKAGALLSADFVTDAALGLVPGYTAATRYGRVRNIDSSDAPVDIWAFADDQLVTRSAIKVFPTSATQIWVASSSALDTAVTVRVEYIDDNGNAAMADVALNGQVPVSVVAAGFDVNRVYVTSPTSSAGTIYVSTSNVFVAGIPTSLSAVLATTPAGYNSSQLSHFTVPAGKSLVLQDLLLMVARVSGSAGSARVTMRVKEFGKASRVRREYFPTTSAPVTNGVHNMVIPGRSQVVWRVDEVSDSDTNLSVTWSYVLVDN